LWHERPIWRGAILASIWIVLLLVINSAAQVPFLFVRLHGVTTPEEMIPLLQNLAHASAPDALTIASYIFNSLINALFRPLLGIAFVVLYFDAKARL
jgi:hypothetical protein